MAADKTRPLLQNSLVLITSVIGLFVVVSISGNSTLNVTLSVVSVGTTGGDIVAEMKKKKNYALEIKRDPTRFQKFFLSLVLLLISNLINELRLHQFLRTCLPLHF